LVSGGSKLSISLKRDPPFFTPGGSILFLMEPLKMKEGVAGGLKAGFTGIWAPLVLGRAERRLTILVKPAPAQGLYCMIIRYWAFPPWNLVFWKTKYL
jgi:hypothetical protein